MTTRTWDTTTPADTGYAGDGDDRIRDTKVDLKERLEQDHYMDGELNPLNGNCDGYHRKATLYAQATDPTPLTGTGVIYTKVVDGVTELFFRDATTGTINQLTENGVLSLNTLANDIDANGHGITGADIIEADQLQSTIATGTAPLIVASTTKVTNLNADLLDGYNTGNASGNIPVSNGTVNTNLNADLLDGKHAPSGAIVGDTDGQWISGKVYVNPVVYGTLSGGVWNFNSLIRCIFGVQGSNNNDTYDYMYDNLEDGRTYFVSGIWKDTDGAILATSIQRQVGNPSVIKIAGVGVTSGVNITKTITNGSSSNANYGKLIVYNSF